MIFLLPHAIDEAAARDDSQDAFRSPGACISYGDLAAQSNQLAHALLDQGLCRGDRVGIFVPPCTASAVAVYGILKAGGAYVPIDSMTPAGRLKQQIADCGLRFIVTHGAPLDVLQEVSLDARCLECVIGAECSLSDAVRTVDWKQLQEFPAAQPPRTLLMEQDLAYLMYTSGSTGRAKAIMHTHYSGLSYVRLSAYTYGVTSDDVLGNHSPLHFDMSTFGYLTGPFAGATTILIPAAFAKLPASLSQLMEAERMTIWYSVPFALIQLLTRGGIEARDLSALRWVLYGGEPFPPKHLYALMQKWPQARFSNVYGPAEVNQCTYYHVPPPTGSELPDAPIPIGHVWSNTEGLVVDEQDRPVPQGQVGELLIRSPTMMQGYWERPDLNSLAFYRERKYTSFNHTYYRTGDLVKVRHDGNLVFLGRRDRQIKIRGYRIELDDVERTLAAHAGVEEAAAYPVRTQVEIEEIRAAVILRCGTEIDPRQLRDFAAEHLPWYTVPATIEIVSELPRTATGKIDRGKLQAVAESPAKLKAEQK